MISLISASDNVPGLPVQRPALAGPENGQPAALQLGFLRVKPSGNIQTSVIGEVELESKCGHTSTVESETEDNLLGINVISPEEL
jgi:hypothetical protein